MARSLKVTIQALRSHLRALPFIAAMLTACSGGGGSQDLLQELEENRTLWQSRNLSDYSYFIQRNCFCTFAGEQIEVQVEDGTVVGARSVPGGAPVPGAADSFSTIDQQFDFLESVLQQGPQQYTVRFDEDFGYPANVALDQTGAADDELEAEVVLAGDGAPCGPTFCGAGLVCCNASCGICTPPGGACIQIACE